MTLLDTAREMFQSAQFQSAFETCQLVLRDSPKNADAWFLMANICQRLGNTDFAMESVRQTLLLDPFRAVAHALEGELWQDRGNLAEAERALRRAILAKADLFQARNSLGIVLMDQRRFAEAETEFRAAIKTRPGAGSGYTNLASALIAQDRKPEATRSLRQALAADPDNVIAHRSLGMLLAAQGDEDGALIHYGRVVALQPANDEVHVFLARIYRKRQNVDAAMRHFQAALKVRADDATLWNDVADFFWEQGDAESAITAYRRVLQIQPDSLRAQIRANVVLPMIYRDSAHIEQSRARVTSGVKELVESVSDPASEPGSKWESEIGWANFYLAYQGMNDREFQRDYAFVVKSILSKAAPRFFSPIPARPAKGRRLRVGFASNNFYDCTAGRYFESWVTQLDGDRFEAFVYHLNGVSDPLTARIKASAAHWRDVAGQSLLQVADAIASDKLDILVYPEQGMNLLLFPLASMRLAPLQCVGWGHPVTTGHENIDVFFSPAMMEPADHAGHYVEKLVTLPGLGTNYRLPTEQVAAIRADFQLPHDKLLFLVPQSLFKIHPDNDALFLDILEAVPDLVLVMFAAEHPSLTQRFINRLAGGFAARGLQSAGRIKILPRMTHPEYLRICQMCDAMLDTLHWSGGNTSLDALAVGLPIVTLPGEFMRGRQSYAMLQMVGCEELVATDRQDYVRIATRLARDGDFRKELSQRIRAMHGSLFGQEEPLRAFNDALAREFAAKSEQD